MIPVSLTPPPERTFYAKTKFSFRLARGILISSGGNRLCFER